ncbi:class I SAM-dependent methyltransferase [Acetobacter sp. TBRC 12305]|uniref:Class I SAM-dependent methyltransferase n=1 Tax=Acetobacter garciniae TaxID=2817435 RepID=A0A939KME9_9PROT|nr:class I SAM-dependent methyltransferase [Acetobacter garciniae]MBO1325253.1 class I SAM-dependent methyltransferase [Acetobacter garciniae]MBX0344775.1 class I SAM-dependent methyltransferase [Acetobacter garciniae]
MVQDVLPTELSANATPPSAAEPEPTPTPCPICHAPSHKCFEKDGYPIVQCTKCDFLFVHPMPSDAQIVEYYATNYRAANADFYPKDRSRRWRAFWRSLPFIPYIFNRDIVDLGCGGGHMLAALCRFARSGVGVDVSANSIAFAKKHFPRQTFYAEGLSAFAGRGRQFDFVFSSELLEHLRSPDEFMTTVHAITRPGSVVYLSAPDAGHHTTPANIAEWSDICPPEHLQWFNETNLNMLFAQYGFEPMKRHRKSTPAHSAFFHRVR